MKTLIPLLTFLIYLASLHAQNIDSINIVHKYINSSRNQKKEIAKKIIKQNISFDYIYKNIKKGREYSNAVKRGFIESCYTNKQGIKHQNLIFIPKDYSPQKKYHVKVFLHGAVSSFDIGQVYQWVVPIDTTWNSVKQICIFPSGWSLSKWWNYSQYENINELISFVKENYNIDENNIYLQGISDGATGLYYLSNINPTIYSCYVPLIGSMKALGVLSKEQMYLKNYQGLSFFIVNTRKDQIFNIHYNIPYCEALKKTGKDVRFIVVDSSKHSTKWYPILRDSIKNFIESHKRNPFPDTLYYSSDNCDSLNRKFWVAINSLGTTKFDSNVEDFNQTTANSVKIQLFPRKKRFGQIEVIKSDNIIYVKTQGVRKYTLLLSPEHFDFSNPVIVYTNGQLSFGGILSKDLHTLLKYNIIDNDREMLYGAELTITVNKVIIRKK